MQHSNMNSIADKEPRREPERVCRGDDPVAPHRKLLEVTEILLNAGAQVNVTDTCTRLTLLNRVEYKGYVTMRQLLVASGARSR